ncbi:MAG TPA: amino acid adenylation domain-containing protein, partial [Candidatus Binatia bacterium]
MNAPRALLTPALSAQIAKYKTEIIGFLQGGHAPSQSTVARSADDEPAPLSFAQERLWLLEQLEPGRPVYNLARAVRIIGPLNLRALESSLSELVRRHEGLRTQFVAVEGRALQRVTAPQPVRLDPIDLSALPAEKRKKRTERLLFETSRRPFELAQERLFRIRLLKERADAHVLIFCMHHMITDAWSMGIFTGELWLLYRNFIDGIAPVLAEPTVRYREYALWQRQQLQDDLLETHLVYWREQLADAPWLDLSTDRPRPVEQTFRGGRQPLELSSALTAAVNDLSRREGATLFMTLLAAFQLLLHRYTGQEDIVVGTPVANREHRGFEDGIGIFVNTLALRVDLSGQPSFKELLHRVREVCLDAYAHQVAPFEKIVEALNPQRELNRNPIFQTMLVLQNTPRSSIDPPAGIRLEPIEIDNQTAQFDLSLYLREREGKLLGFIEYSADLFDAAPIGRMAGHYRTLLENAVADPGRSIATLPMLGVGERRRLLVEWNDTAAEYLRDACIDELFEARVKRTPDALALEFEGGGLTYRELNHRANQLAYELSELGAGPGKLVGVMIERSFELAASILAILKAGAAYVPLDPSYPAERLNFMVADAAIAVVLTQRKFANRVATRGATFFVDEPSGGKLGRARNLNRRATADSPAYVIYTSGSTGTPKAVVALHRGAVNRFAWMWKTYPFGPNEKICQKTSLSFVDSVWEVFGALLRGVPTVIVPEMVAREPEGLVHYLARHRVTRVVLVPSLLREILRLPNLGKRLARLKFCFSSGEPLPVELVAQFRRALPSCRLVNLYGSSEVSADVTYYEVDTDPSPAAVSIGRPIDNTQIYLLDSQLQPVPIGARGELCVGGDNVARGYFNRPEVTAEKFVPNPFSTGANSRLFRTGDLARYRADGNLEFLGRADGQIKIRGCRVELGEIEFALRRHPDVRECSVVVHPATQPESDNPKSKIEDPKCDSTIVAYVVPRERPPAAGELRAFLKERLPDYMLPVR